MLISADLYNRYQKFKHRQIVPLFRRCVPRPSIFSDNTISEILSLPPPYLPFRSRLSHAPRSISRRFDRSNGLQVPRHQYVSANSRISLSRLRRDRGNTVKSACRSLSLLSLFRLSCTRVRVYTYVRSISSSRFARLSPRTSATSGILPYRRTPLGQ